MSGHHNFEAVKREPFYGKLSFMIAYLMQVQAISDVQRSCIESHEENKEADVFLLLIHYIGEAK